MRTGLANFGGEYVTVIATHRVKIHVLRCVFKEAIVRRYIRQARLP